MIWTQSPSSSIYDFYNLFCANRSDFRQTGDMNELLKTHLKSVQPFNFNIVSIPFYLEFTKFYVKAHPAPPPLKSCLNSDFLDEITFPLLFMSYVWVSKVVMMFNIE